MSNKELMVKRYYNLSREYEIRAKYLIKKSREFRERADRLLNG